VRVWLSPHVMWRRKAWCSAQTALLGGGFHYFNFNQKVFEVSDEPGKGTIGIVTWGLGSFGTVSHRTLTALLDDDLKAEPPSDLAEVATRWCDIVWPRYTPLLARCHALAGKSPFDKNSPPNPSARTEAEEIEFDQWKRGLTLGYYIGGYLSPARVPQAFSINFDPLQGKSAPVLFQGYAFAGAPNMVRRLLYGYDEAIPAA
jgi:hypothetical protein